MSEYSPHIFGPQVQEVASGGDLTPLEQAIEKDFFAGLEEQAHAAAACGCLPCGSQIINLARVRHFRSGEDSIVKKRAEIYRQEGPPIFQAITSLRRAISVYEKQLPDKRMQ